MPGRRGGEGEGVKAVAMRAMMLRLSRKGVRARTNEGVVVEVRVGPTELCGRKTRKSENENGTFEGLDRV